MMSVREARRVVYWSCERKHRYDSRREARQDSTVQRGATTPYRCPWCRGFHVGHAPSMVALRRIAQAIRVLAQEEAA